MSSTTYASHRSTIPLASVERKLDHLTVELRLYAGILTTIGLGILWRVWH